MKVDTKAVAEKWPEEYERPTPRAITERVVTIRKRAGVKLRVSGSSSNAAAPAPAPAPANGSQSLPSTPTRRNVKQEGSDAGGSTGKRKRQSRANNRRGSGSGGIERTVSAKELRELQSDAARVTGNGAADTHEMEGFQDVDYWNTGASSEVDILESPTKRMRVSGRAQRVSYHDLVKEEDYPEEDNE